MGPRPLKRKRLVVRVFDRVPTHAGKKTQMAVRPSPTPSSPAPKPSPSQRVEVRASNPAANRMSISEQRQRRKARLAALAWLKSAYPVLFDYPPKPLAIGMGKTIFIAAKAAGIENHPVRAALSYWVGSHSYQIALAAPGAMRCDVSGVEVEAVDAQHAEEARKRLEGISARKAAKRAQAP
jgi:hypothetical protein